MPIRSSSSSIVSSLFLMHSSHAVGAERSRLLWLPRGGCCRAAAPSPRFCSCSPSLGRMRSSRAAARSSSSTNVSPSPPTPVAPPSPAASSTAGAWDGERRFPGCRNPRAALPGGSGDSGRRRGDSFATGARVAISVASLAASAASAALKLARAWLITFDWLRARAIARAWAIACWRAATRIACSLSAACATSRAASVRYPPSFLTFPVCCSGTAGLRASGRLLPSFTGASSSVTAYFSFVLPIVFPLSLSLCR